MNPQPLYEPGEHLNDLRTIHEGSELGKPQGSKRQQESYRITKNYRMLSAITSNKNEMFGLSPTTREAFAAFVAGVKSDTEFIRDQKDLYEDANVGVLREIRKYNAKSNQERVSQFKKLSVATIELQRIKKSAVPKFDCSRCKDAGMISVGFNPDGSERTPLFCTCAAGVRCMKEYRSRLGINCIPCLDLGTKQDYNTGVIGFCDCKIGKAHEKRHLSKKNKGLKRRVDQLTLAKV